LNLINPGQGASAPANATAVAADRDSLDSVPNLQKTILLHQLQQEFGILAVRLLLLGSPGPDLRWIADPHFEA